MSAGLDDELYGALATIVGEDALVAPERIDEYAREKSPFPRSVPRAVVQVRSEGEIAAVLRIAGAVGVPVVSRGNGFSLAGPPAGPGVDPLVLDMRGFNRIVEIDEESMTITAECGVTMLSLRRAAAERGYELHTVAVPVAHTTLGGVLSGVCGGGFPLDTASVGGTGQFVTGLRVVLADGSILETNAGGSNVHRRSSSIGISDGPQLTQLFVGDGGALGVKIRATLAMAPLRSEVEAGCFEFEGFEAAAAAMRELQRIPETPYANLYISKGNPWSMTFTSKASSQVMLRHHVSTINATARRHGGRPGGAELEAVSNLVATMDPAWGDQFIGIERGAVAAVFGNRDFPHACAALTALIKRIVDEDLHDVDVEPITFMTPYGRHAVWYATSLPYDPAGVSTRQRIATATRELYEQVVTLGGWSEPHHGVVSRVLAQAWSPEYRAVVEGIRQLVDPQATLNGDLWRGGSAS